MKLIGAAFDCGNGIDNSKTAILVAVPIKPHVFSLILNDTFYKPNDGTGAIGRCMAHSVADAYGASSTTSSP